MATYYSDVISVSVTFGDRAVSTTGFSTPLFVSHHNVFDTRQVAYTSLTDITDAGFAVGSPLYKWATGVFAGAQAPSYILAGRAVPSSYTVQVDTTVEEDDTLSIYVKLDGTSSTVEYTVLAADVGDAQALGDGLATEIALVSGITTAVSDANGLITITLDDDTLPTSFGVAENTTIYVDTAETPTEILSAIDEENSDYAIVCAESHETATQELYAAYVETADMLYIYSSQDEDSYDPVSEDDIFYLLKSAGYQFSCGMYYSGADADFPEGALVGTFADQSPSYNWTANLQTLVGITVDTLTTSQEIALTAKNANFYVEEYDEGAFHEGWTSNTDFLDRSRFGLWLKVRTQESLYSTMKSFASQSSSLAYSDAGIAVAKANLYSDVISLGITNGTILTGSSEDSTGSIVSYTPVIETSTRASQSSSNISNRYWSGFEITVYYTGSIHTIDVDAYIQNS